MSEYNIPTDGDIRSAYDAMCQLASAVGDFLSTLTGGSDRWLAEHDREVAAKTLIDAAQDIYLPADGTTIHADVNGAYNILRKRKPSFGWSRGFVVKPTNLAFSY